MAQKNLIIPKKKKKNIFKFCLLSYLVYILDTNKLLVLLGVLLAVKLEPPDLYNMAVNVTMVTILRLLLLGDLLGREALW